MDVKDSQASALTHFSGFSVSVNFELLYNL